MKFLFSIVLFACIGISTIFAAVKPSLKDPLIVKKSPDFALTGNGSSPEWSKTQWIPLIKLDAGGEENKTRFKIMYSGKGIYLLFEGKDSKITTKFDRDFDNLFEGDVFEVFFHPDPKYPIYLEYEVNHLNKELVLIIPNIKGNFKGWIPWKYENENRVIKKVNIVGGKMEKDAKIKAWSAELFFPYGLFSPLPNVPPVSGTTWNANFYRLDYDTGKMIKWAWTPINKSFHEFEKYGSILFE
jgi:hypothetical protein